MTIASEPPTGSGEDSIPLELRQQERRVARAFAKLEEDLQDQLATLSDGFGGRLGPTDPAAHLATDVVRSLTEAGFTMHDWAAKDRTGGVFLVPTSGRDSLVVSWITHDALRLDPRRYREDEAAREVMNYALCDTLTTLGWDVREYGPAGANLVIGRLAVGHQEGLR